ncbi:Rho guanine nucleotide exchange factor 18 [Holothuria leucospilota]|uniref:Rho guanine nucleotide exchange factor 18 n=1 Tax=Holothuria leucospilota TaxID=206669 RepID=A0A9Q1BLZ6_HOLLE|nr:Rho guanine nucleotide exchange factor 18 [Holothuria leucospilota]
MLPLPELGHLFSMDPGCSRTIDENEEAEERPGSPPKQSNFQNSLSYSMESLDDVSGETLQYEADEDLTTGPEPESWSATVEKKILKKMSNKEIKRQDVIFEFIMTEKHHLRTLKVMQKIFSYGMTHELSMDQSIVSKVFPSLGELVDISSSFYDSLKARQGESLAVEKIGDVLCKHFEGANGDIIKAAYGSLCSRQKEAVSVYKDLQKTDRKFQSFIKKCSTNALCRRWSIPECILSVSHRLTKYQLLIEAIIKPTKATKADKVDTANLERALALIKGICNEVDLQVEEHEKWQRLIDIYNKIEARATAPMKNGKKFKKSDLLSNNRKFIKEGELFWKSARGRLTEVHVVIISDLLLLLSENNQKYTFASQDSKPPVISLENLMVRDVAIDTKSIYIISRYKQGPEMYEISCKSSQDRDQWKKAIEKAVAECPIQEETAEEEKRLAEEKLAKMGKILEDWKETDKQLLNIITTKIKMSKELRELALSREDVSSQVRAADKDVRLDEGSEVLQAAIKEASFLQSSIYQNPNYLLGRSASSAGERDSQSMYLPKRAETFSGFDSTTAQGPNKRSTSNVLLAESSTRSSSFPNLSNDEQISQGTPSPLLPDDSDISREEDDVLSPMSPLNRDSPQRSPLPHRRASERSTDSTSSGRRDSTELSRTRSHTVSTTVSNKVQFNVPSEENRRGSRQDLQEGEEMESLATGGFNPEQLQSVNQLMKYFYLLLPILSQKDYNIETLKNKLAEAQNEIETLKSHSHSLVETRKNPSSAPASPAGQDLRGRTASTRSLQEKSDQQGVEKLNNQRSLPEGSVRQEQLTRIAFGDNLPSGQLIRYRNHSQSTYPKDTNTSEGLQHQSLQVGSVNKNRYSSAEMITGRLMWDSDMEPPPPISTSSNNRRQTPTHLMSATNEQAAQSSTVKQQIPLQLSKGSAGPKTSQVQQVLPKKLSSGSSKSSLSQKGKNNFTEGQQADEVIFF